MFAPLQVKSAYSLLQSPLKISDYVEAASKMGYEALCLTDVDVLYGAFEFFEACRKYGIKKPVIGIELNMQGDGEEEPISLLLLAKNAAGYRNLVKISSKKLSENSLDPHDNPQTCDDIKDYLDGVAVIVSPESIKVASSPKFFKKLQSNGAKLYLGKGPQFSRELLLDAYRIAETLKIPQIALSKVEYLKPDDYFGQVVLQAIDADERINFDQRMSGSEYLKSPSEYQLDYKNAGMETEFGQTEKLLSEVDFWLTPSEISLPHYKFQKGVAKVSAHDYLKRLCADGIKRCFRENPNKIDIYQKRLDHELKVIHEMGFEDYFLIVSGITQYARSVGIIVGPGRGSAAGSLVSYVLRITDVDPIKYNLLFERFLNEERHEMPDIDLDIPDNKRDRIIKYVYDTYGSRHMAQIITFDTFGAKQALRDGCRIFGLTQAETDAWSKAIPFGDKMTLERARRESQRIRNLIADSKRNERLFETAQKLEGLPRHFSTHAAGIVLSDQNLDEVVPVQIGNDGYLMTQFSKKPVEKAGLLKIDLLGLKNLRILNTAKDLVNQNAASKLDLEQIPLDDKATLELFYNAKTEGIFQFDSYGIRQAMLKIRPENFEDVVALNALYRPGPIRNIDEFTARRHGRKTVSYPAKVLEPILNSTYGIIVYQEQAMQVSSKMGGFTLGEADILRQAISKKEHETIERMRVKFVAGAQKKGFSKEDALRVYDYIERFGEYGFNRSHAVAYSKMAFQMAYLKAHYPAEFYCALLSTVIGNVEKTQSFLAAAKKRKIKILAPDINKSSYDFRISDGGIMFGFLSVKGIRFDFIRQILAERHAGGYRPFKSLDDFMNRMVERALVDKHDHDGDAKKREKIAKSYRPIVETLIYVGAFDSLEADRSQLLNRLDVLSKYDQLSMSVPLLESLFVPSKKNVKKLTLDERLEKEKERLGVYLSAHPLDKYSAFAQGIGASSLASLVPDQQAIVLVRIKEVKNIKTKKGDEMAFVSCIDQTGEMEATFFPKQFLRYHKGLKKNAELLFYGRVQDRNGLSFVVDRVEPIEYIALHFPNTITIETKRQLFAIMKRYLGPIPVIVEDEAKQTKKILDRRFWLKKDQKMLEEIGELLNRENIRYVKGNPG